MSDFPEDFLNAIATQYQVSDAELDTLRLALDGKTAKEISKSLEISAPAVRKRLGAIYSKFKISGGTSGKLAALREILIERLQQSQTRGRSPSGLENAPDVSKGFSGRVQELNYLEQWIVKDNCRLIAILGMGGMGKTSLAIKLALKVQDKFDHFIWRSFREGQPPEDFLEELLKTFEDPEVNSSQSEGIKNLPESFANQLEVFVDHLQTHRYLIILDSMEIILGNGERAGHYQSGFENYGALLWRLGESKHQSCVVITSREKPREIAILYGRNLPVRSLSLKGLNLEEAQELLEDKGQFQFKSQWDEVVERYGGNPLALKIIAASIEELFGGNVNEFLNVLKQTREQLFGDVRNILQEQFERLSDLEKEIMYWLAINNPLAQKISVTLMDLKQDILSPVSLKEILDATESLMRRSLLELDDKHKIFRLQQVVTEYTLDRLVEHAADEIKSVLKQDKQSSEKQQGQNLTMLRKYALIKAHSPDPVREQQVRSILRPLANFLLKEFINLDQLKRQCFAILNTLRNQSPLETGYAAGNLLNLLIQLGIVPGNSDFRSVQISNQSCEQISGQTSGETFKKISNWSRLVLRQAYLPQINLPDFDFSHSQFIDTVFKESFGNVFSVAFSPDGHYLAAGHSRGEIHLWQVNEPRSSSEQIPMRTEQKFQLVGTLKGHQHWVHVVDFSPDSQQIASGSQDETIKIWELETKTCMSLPSQGGRVWSVAWNPNGKILASGCEDATIKLWDGQNGKSLDILSGHQQRVRSVAWSSGGEWLASGSDDQTIKIWDGKTGNCRLTLVDHTEAVMAVAFAPQPTPDTPLLLASASEDKTVKLWDGQTGICLRTLNDHSDRLIALAFSPDGTVLASGGKDRQIKLWSVATGVCLAVLQGHNNRVWSVAFSPDGKTLVSGSDDQTIKLWDINVPDIQNASISSYKTLIGYANQFWSVAFSPDGRLIAAGSDDKVVRLFDSNSGERLQRLEEHTKRVRAVAFSPDGKTLASGSEDQTLRLWDVSHGICQMRLREHTKWVCAVAFTPDGTTLASGSEDSTLKLWKVETGQRIHSWLADNEGGVLTLAFSPNGKTLASGGEDSTLKLWNLQFDPTFQCWDLPISEAGGQHLAGHEGWIWSVAFSPDGKILASGGEDNLIKLWNPKTGDCLNTCQGHDNWIWAVTFTPDGKTLISGSADNTIRFWDVQTAKCLKVLNEPNNKHENWVRSVAVSPDGNQLVSGSADETIKLWELATQRIHYTRGAQRPYQRMKITGVQFPQLNEQLNSKDTSPEEKSKIRNYIEAQTKTLLILGAKS